MTSNKRTQGKKDDALAPAVPGVAKQSLEQVRAHIDGIDQQIQALIAERAEWAQQVGRAKGRVAAAVEYYRPEREAQVLRRVVDRNAGPLSDAVLVRLFREIMSACLAQQQPLKIGYLGPEGTFSEQAMRQHFGHSALGLPMAGIEMRRIAPAPSACWGGIPICWSPAPSARPMAWPDCASGMRWAMRA